MSRKQYQKWSPEQTEKFKALYPTLPNRELAEMFNTTDDIVRQRACTYKIKKLKTARQHPHQRTVSMREILAGHKPPAGAVVKKIHSGTLTAYSNVIIHRGL